MSESKKSRLHSKGISQDIEKELAEIQKKLKWYRSTIQDIIREKESDCTKNQTEIESLQSQLLPLQKECALIQMKIAELDQKINGLQQETTMHQEFIQGKRTQYTKEVSSYIQRMTDLFGKYDINTLGPVLATLVSLVTGNSYHFSKQNFVGKTAVCGYTIHYRGEVAEIRKDASKEGFFFATSGVPSLEELKKGGLIANYVFESTVRQKLPKTSFATSGEVRLVCYDWETNHFNQDLLSTVEEIPTYVGSFIEYVSDYRAKNAIGPKTITSSQLMDLANEFLKQYENNSVQNHQEKIYTIE